MGLFNFFKKNKGYKRLQNETKIIGNDFLDSPNIPNELKNEIQIKLPDYIPFNYDDSYNTEARCLGHILSGTITTTYDFELAKKIFEIILTTDDIYVIYQACETMLCFYENFYKTNNCTFEELENSCLESISFLPFYYSVAKDDNEPIFSNALYRLSIEYKKQKQLDKLFEICKIAIYFEIDTERFEKILNSISKNELIKPFTFSLLGFSSATLPGYMEKVKNRTVYFESATKVLEKKFGKI